MQSTAAEIQELLDKYLADQATSMERARLKELLLESSNDGKFADAIEAVLQQHRFQDTSIVDKDILFQQLLQKSRSYTTPVPMITAHRTRSLRRGWVRYAAAVLIAAGLGTGAYLLTTNKKTKQTLANGNKQLQMDIPPGRDKAILTLADGSDIVLDSVGAGLLANQGGVRVTKLANGQIAYDTGSLTTKEVMWNTMTTPRGGQYQVTLPDGTKVWLNAASSITFPTTFTGNERRVKIDGEVFFEVAKNKQKPFLVNIREESLVQVLGTSFNINCYQDENVTKTTLVEGSVKVSKGNDSLILKPGQQAVASVSTPKFKIVEADIDQAIAWKNGFFSLQDADLKAVLRQLERWYDINVRYDGAISNIIFQGKIFRNTNLSDVIEFLQKAGVNCRLDGKTLIVL